MTPWSDMDYEMRPVPLDMDTADRLLAGVVAPEDAPPGYAGVARFLDALSGEPLADVPADEAEVVAMVAAAVRTSSSSDPSPRRSLMPIALTRPRLTAAFVAAALACSSGLASAGALPRAAQDIASAMLAKVGISVPGPDDHAGTHPSTRGESGSTPANAGKGSDISDLATQTELSGVQKGAAISTAASDSKSQAGQHGAASSAPVTTPNSGGTGTADTASGGQSTDGTSIANAASDGRSSAGSGNASGGQDTAEAAGDGHRPDSSDSGGSGQAHQP